MAGLRGIRWVGVGALLLSCVAAVAQRSHAPTDLTQPVALPGVWEFDVASIRPTGVPDRRTRLYRHPEDVGFGGQNVSLQALVQFAYGVSETRVIGLPAQLATARFDLQAKGDAETETKYHKLNPELQRVAKQKMVQAMLAERCGLKVHFETRELPVFALVVAKSGPKLQKSEQVVSSGWGGWTHIEVEGGDTISRFAEELTRVSGRVVLNQTGITGHYDIELEWSNDDDDESDQPTLFTAIREQLGLALEPRKSMVEVVVVDRMELPSAN